MTIAGDLTLIDRVGEELDILPAYDLETMAKRYDLLQQFITKQMIEGEDYGVIPGTSRDGKEGRKTLLQPGAEKLRTFFGFSVHSYVVEATEDWTGENHRDAEGRPEPFFAYVAETVCSRRGNVIAHWQGACNSWEVKYRYRQGGHTCPACGKSAIFRSKSRKEGDRPGWFCGQKAGGCGANFYDGSSESAEIAAQPVGRIPNPDVCEQVNTFRMIAMKRSFVATVRAATGASKFFTLSDAPGAPPDPEESIDGARHIGRAQTESAANAPQTQRAAGEKCEYCGWPMKPDGTQGHRRNCPTLAQSAAQPTQENPPARETAPQSNPASARATTTAQIKEAFARRSSAFETGAATPNEVLSALFPGHIGEFGASDMQRAINISDADWRSAISRMNATIAAIEDPVEARLLPDGTDDDGSDPFAEVVSQRPLSQNAQMR